MSSPLKTSLQRSSSSQENRNSFPLTLRHQCILLSWFKPLGSGIILDIRARTPWYFSDWKDAWNYRVVPATALIFFANIGPITVFNKTIYNILERQADPPNYLHFIGWVYLWAAIIHWITYVTLFSCDTFGFYVSWVYLQYGIQVTTRQLRETDPPNTPGAFVAIILALLMLVTSFLFQSLSRKSFFHRKVRRFLADYGMPMSLIASSAMAYWGRFNAANPSTLPIGRAFQPAGGREWLVRFWQLDGKWVGIALPFGIVLWILFFFDHNVSSLMAQSSDFPLRKPPGFHWDFFLLGVTTFIAGLLGLPAPNGLIPQAPIHTASLVVMGHPDKKRHDTEDATINESGAQTPIPLDAEALGVAKTPTSAIVAMQYEVPIAVVEQRVSNLAQGSLCLILLTGPFLHLLNLIPRGVLAGLFWFMGADALRGNGITQKTLYFLRDRKMTAEDEPLRKVRKSRILLFIAVQLVGFGATFAITQTVGSLLLLHAGLHSYLQLIDVAAIGFPVIIMLLIPVRVFLVPKLPFTAQELAILDKPTASPYKEEFQLGQLLSQLYLNSSSASYINGMNGSIVNDGQFWVRSDAGGEAPVIWNSALALLQGLFQPSVNQTITLANGTTIEAPLNGYQYLPIESVEPDNDMSLEGWTDCNTFNNATVAFYNSTEFQQMTTEYSSFLNSLPPYLDGRAVTLQNMWNIYDFMNVESTYNAAFAEALPPGYLEIARYLANWHEYNVFSDPKLNGIGNIAGQTIIPSIINGFNDILDDTNPIKFVYHAISYKPFISLFNMTQVTTVNPELAGIGEPRPEYLIQHADQNCVVNYAAALALEVRQPSSGSQAPVLRFNFMNGTGADWVTYPVLGSNSSEILLSDFINTLQVALLFRSLPVGIDTWNEWCSVCSNTQDRGCAALTLAASEALADQVQPKISRIGAGFLGAGLMLVVALAMFIMLFFLGCLTIGAGRRRRPSKESA
ncbi:hypothetical protein H0H92_006058 [Tricholoma furcatifolium]|nr:hypothetical protein H0H92_006058 [Tricholoma furcatifolium]